MRWEPRLFGALLAVFCTATLAATGDQPAKGGASVLERIQKIKLSGRVDKKLDQLAIDSARNRLFVANMANRTLDIIDLKEGKLLKSIPDQKGIQCVTYSPQHDRVFVGLGVDGYCNAFDGEKYGEACRQEVEVRFDTTFDIIINTWSASLDQEYQQRVAAEKLAGEKQLLADDNEKLKEKDQRIETQSLCDTCKNMREVRTARSRFLLCELSVTDAAYPTYPPQPVVRCDGYQLRDKVIDSMQDESPGQ